MLKRSLSLHSSLIHSLHTLRCSLSPSRSAQTIWKILHRRGDAKLPIQADVSDWKRTVESKQGSIARWRGGGHQSSRCHGNRIDPPHPSLSSLIAPPAFSLNSSASDLPSTFALITSQSIIYFLSLLITFYFCLIFLMNDVL